MNFVIDNRVPQIRYDETAKALTVVLVECKVGTFSQCSGSLRLYLYMLIPASKGSSKNGHLWKS